MFDNEDDEMAAKKEQLAKLMEYARGGMARDTLERLGKLPKDDGDDAPDAGSDIPGVEASDEGSPDEEASESPDQEAAEQDQGQGDVDPAKLKLILMQLKAKGG